MRSRNPAHQLCHDSIYVLCALEGFPDDRIARHVNRHRIHCAVVGYD